REEFCLVIGLRFGVEYNADYNNEDDPIPFRRKVFSSAKDGKPIIGKMLEEKIKSELFYRLKDHDDVSLCCVGILQFVLLGLEDRRKQQEDDEHKSYSLFGFTWALKGRLPTRRLTPDEFEAGSDWWVSSKAYFDGHISEAARIPRHVNRQNQDDVPS
ncbi:hypothetical protein Tco_0621606, partial [Tanacetum coccineum]